MPALPGVMKSLLVGMLTADTQFPNTPNQNCGSGLARESGLAEKLMLNGPTPSRASSLPQGNCGGHKICEHPQSKLWERACSRKRSGCDDDVVPGA